MMMTTTFNTKHEIPMDKITYDTINKHNQYIMHIIKNDWSARFRFITLPCDISYDEDLQIASFDACCFLFSIEQTPDYFIITMDCFDILPKLYLINKKTGEITMHSHVHRYYPDLIDALLRVYGKTEDELMETDFISDKLKPKIQMRIWARQ